MRQALQWRVLPALPQTCVSFATQAWNPLPEPRESP
nr:MAG TPA: hypothetical protein [Caudoviricetes sp.]